MSSTPPDASMAAAAGIKVSSRFNMVLNAGKATPQPPVGSALGQRGLNLMNFCKAFNDETAKYLDTVPIRVRAAHRPHRTSRFLCTRRSKLLQVRVTAFADRTFTFETKGPPSTYLLLKAAGIEKGADKPGYETVGKLSVKHIYEIAKVRPSDSPPASVLYTHLHQPQVKHEVDPGLKHVSLHSVCTQLVASCKSIGIQVYAPERTP